MDVNGLPMWLMSGPAAFGLAGDSGTASHVHALRWNAERGHLTLASQQQHGDHRDDAHDQQVDHDGAAGAVDREEGGGDERGERGAANLGDRVADRRAAVADLRGEDHAEQRPGHSTGRRHRDAEDEHESGAERERVAGVDQGEAGDVACHIAFHLFVVGGLGGVSEE